MWLLGSHFTILWLRAQHKGALPTIKVLVSSNRGFSGMWLAHIGVACFIVGITIVSHYSLEQDLRMAPGDQHEVAGYQFLFTGIGSYTGPNYQASQGHFQVTQDGQQVATLDPEKRTYQGRGMPMTEAAIDPALTRDLYISLGEPIGTTGTWSVRIHYKPYVRWIWLGGLLMAFGGLISVSDRRYRLRHTASSPITTTV
jgi:cytochrome c-type biogenesis protein CcmF